MIGLIRNNFDIAVIKAKIKNQFKTVDKMSLTEKTELRKRQDQDFKIQMLLKEAEIFQANISIISTLDNPGDLEKSLLKWLSMSADSYKGSVNMMAKDTRKNIFPKKIKNISLSSISHKIKLRGISEMILIGDDLSILMIEDNPVIVRDSRHAAYVAKIMNHSVEIAVLESKFE